MSQPNNWRALLGLAARAGKTASGEDTVLRMIRAQKAKIVLLADDASARTQKTITNKCRYYRVPLFRAPDRLILGQSIGQPARVVVAVLDIHFAGGLIAQLERTIRR